MCCSDCLYVLCVFVYVCISELYVCRYVGYLCVYVCNVPCVFTVSVYVVGRMYVCHVCVRVLFSGMCCGVRMLCFCIRDMLYTFVKLCIHVLFACIYVMYV